MRSFVRRIRLCAFYEVKLTEFGNKTKPRTKKDLSISEFVDSMDSGNANFGNATSAIIWAGTVILGISLYLYSFHKGFAFILGGLIGFGVLVIGILIQIKYVNLLVNRERPYQTEFSKKSRPTSSDRSLMKMLVQIGVLLVYLVFFMLVAFFIFHIEIVIIVAVGTGILGNYGYNAAGNVTDRVMDFLKQYNIRWNSNYINRKFNANRSPEASTDYLTEPK